MRAVIYNRVAQTFCCSTDRPSAYYSKTGKPESVRFTRFTFVILCTIKCALPFPWELSYRPFRNPD